MKKALVIVFLLISHFTYADPSDEELIEFLMTYFSAKGYICYNPKEMPAAIIAERAYKGMYPLKKIKSIHSKRIEKEFGLLNTFS
jgi:hypothetical protein